MSKEKKRRINMSKLKGCEKYITKELVLLENFLIFGDIKKV